MKAIETAVKEMVQVISKKGDVKWPPRSVDLTLLDQAN